MNPGEVPDLDDRVGERDAGEVVAIGVEGQGVVIDVRPLPVSPRADVGPGGDQSGI